jgi:hypothetical protein
MEYRCHTRGHRARHSAPLSTGLVRFKTHAHSTLHLRFSPPLPNHACPQGSCRFLVFCCIIPRCVCQRLARSLHLPSQLRLLPLLPRTHANGHKLLTDRFASANGSGSACSPDNRKYCGGNYRGVINHLDYIQNMGFDAIWISPVVSNFEGAGAYGEAYHGFVFTPSSLRSYLTNRQLFLIQVLATGPLFTQRSLWHWRRPESSR